MASPLVPARLAFSAPGVPYSDAFGDVYHSAAGGLEQARHVFLGGNQLPLRWQRKSRFVILETGFGTGLNFLATWRAWREDPARCARLHFVSIEKHPFAANDLQKIHAALPEIQAEAAELDARWPPLVSGAHRLEFDAGQVVLTLFFSDVSVARDLRLQADAFYLDGFAPARNPEMWTPALMRSLSRLAAPGASAATWSVASSVRHALGEAGFAVEKRPGFATKHEMLCAASRKEGRTPFIPQRRAAVVGAGVAGAAVCERLCARGWEVSLFERHAAPAEEASGNPAGAFHPIVTPDDNLLARLTRAGFLHSLERWKALEGARWQRCGALQLARDEKEERSQRRSIAELALPGDYAQFVEREQASRYAGAEVAAGGLWFPQAGWIDPRSLVEAQLSSCGNRLERRFSENLKGLPEAPVVILANGFEATTLCTVPHVALRRVRGQLTYVEAETIPAPRTVVLRGGMVLPPVDGICVVGATFDIDDADASRRAESDESNLERLSRILQLGKPPQPCGGRVAFRAVTRDRVPVAGKIDANVIGAFAYGSRGLVWAALAAELIASMLEGEPLPVEGALAKAMDPLRFRKA